MKLDPVAFTLGLDLRNRVAASLRTRETIVEDELIVIAEAGSKREVIGKRSLGWLLLTNQRLFWAVLPSNRVTEAPLSELRVAFSEEGWDTLTWGAGRHATAVSLGFMDRSTLRPALDRGIEETAQVTRRIERNE